MQSFAQTNIQLFNQLRSEGYSNTDLECISKAYQLVLKLFIGQFRGSGKTFVAHLIGTASILSSLRVPIKVVTAGLLHAAYIRGDFGDLLLAGISDGKRARVRLTVGEEVENYVAKYTVFPWDERTILAIRERICKFNSIDRDLLLMRFANELEDHLDLGVLYCANFSQRQQYIDRSGNLMVEMAMALGFPSLATALAQSFEEVTVEKILPVLRSSHSVSFTILPNAAMHQSSLLHNQNQESPSVTIVVVPRERFSMTERSLESIYEHTSFPFKLVYVDGNSPPATQHYLQSQAKQRGFHLIRTEDFLAPNQARNLGLAQVDTKYVVFIDNDVVVTSGWLEALVSCAEDTGAAIVGPLILIGEPELQIIHWAGGIVRFQEEHGKRIFYEEHCFAGKRLNNLPVPLQRKPCEFVEFHSMLIHMEVMEKIGLFDEKLTSMREHLDFCLTVRDRGCKIYFEPNAVTAYISPPPLKSSDLPYFLLRWSDERFQKNMIHFCQKWGLDANDPANKNDYDWVSQQRQLALLEWERSQAWIEELQTAKDWLEHHSEQTQAWIQELQTAKDWLESQRQAWMERSQRTEAELEQAKATITGMESSKFWRLRSVWFQMKQVIGLSKHD